MKCKFSIIFCAIVVSSIAHAAAAKGSAATSPTSDSAIGLKYLVPSPSTKKASPLTSLRWKLLKQHANAVGKDRVYAHHKILATWRKKMVDATINVLKKGDDKAKLQAQLLEQNQANTELQAKMQKLRAELQAATHTNKLLEGVNRKVSAENRKLAEGNVNFATQLAAQDLP